MNKNNSNYIFTVHDLVYNKEKDKHEGLITIENNEKEVGSLSYNKFKYKIYIDHVYVDEEKRGKGLCPKLLKKLIDTNPDIDVYMLSSYGGISSCKCYIKAFMNEKFKIYIGGGLFDYDYFRKSNKTVKSNSTIRLKSENIYKRKNNIENICTEVGNRKDFLFIR
jgi:hypothetical protein